MNHVLLYLLYHLFSTFQLSSFDTIGKLLKKQKCLYQFITFNFPVLLQQLNGDASFHKSDNIMDKKWDNLIVLDACRFDLFEEVNWLKGTLSKRYSPASNTKEWVSRCLRQFHKDVMLITANPYLSRYSLKNIIGCNPFSHVEDVWNDHWDKDLDVVKPRDITRAARKMLIARPDKRCMIWYLQPHHPFIGKTKLKRHINKMRNGVITEAYAYQAYRENLELVLSEIENHLLPFLRGKTVITSDHGECFGEMFIHGHPQRIHIPPLIEVPYFELDN